MKTQFPSKLSTSGEIVATAGEVTVDLGARFGLYELLSRGPVTSQELARATPLPQWFIDGWLSAQMSAGNVRRHDETNRHNPEAKQRVA